MELLCEDLRVARRAQIILLRENGRPDLKAGALRLASKRAFSRNCRIRCLGRPRLPWQRAGEGSEGGPAQILQSGSAPIMARTVSPKHTESHFGPDLNP